MHFKQPSGVIFILAHGVSLILAQGVNRTWFRGSTARGFSTNGYISDYWTIIHRNREKFSQDRLAFLACDVRNYICDTLAWYDNIDIVNCGNDRIVADAYTLFAEYMVAHPDTDVMATHFTIDCQACRVTTKPYKPSKPRYDTNGEKVWQPTAKDPSEELSFVRSYILFANCLDHQYRCELAKDSYREVCDIVSAPIYENGRWGFRWQKVDNWHLSPATEYVVSIDKVKL